jgi:tetratricopeptide (TPR) repeat protein
MSPILIAQESTTVKLINHKDQLWFLGALGNVCVTYGQPSYATLLYSKLNELRKDNEGYYIFYLRNISLVQYAMGALGEAERNLLRCIDLCRKPTNEFFEKEVDCQIQLAAVYSYCGKFKDAREALERSIFILNDFSSVLGISGADAVADIWLSRALHYLLIARADPQSKIINLKSAIECAVRACELAKVRKPNNLIKIVIGNLIGALGLLGTAYRENGELTKAEENLYNAISMIRQTNFVSREANILLNLAHLRYDQERYEEAKTLADEALLITERCGYVLQGADVNLFLAQYALEQEKDKAKAKEYAEEAKKLATGWEEVDGKVVYDTTGEYVYKVAYEEAERFLENLK